jgi:hypothetical protein
MKGDFAWQIRGHDSSEIMSSDCLNGRSCFRTCLNEQPPFADEFTQECHTSGRRESIECLPRQSVDQTLFPDVGIAANGDSHSSSH